MYPEDNPSFTEEESKKTSTVDLSECIAILRKNNFISADESVIVIKMDIYMGNPSEVLIKNLKTGF